MDSSNEDVDLLFLQGGTRHMQGMSLRTYAILGRDTLKRNNVYVETHPFSAVFRHV
jgi:hypothetical protein